MADNTPAHRYRAGDADRDRILTLLQDAYEAGRLGFDELGERQEQALRSRFTDELAPLVAYLPGAGDEVDVVDRAGQIVCRGVATQSLCPSAFDKTPVVRFRVDEAYLMAARGIRAGKGE